MPRVSEAELARRAQLLQAAMFARAPHWTVLEIAGRTGIHHSTVSRIVRGLQAGPEPRVRAISRLLGIPLSQLFDDEGSEDSPPAPVAPLNEGTPTAA